MTLDWVEYGKLIPKEKDKGQSWGNDESMSTFLKQIGNSPRRWRMLEYLLNRICVEYNFSLTV